MGPSERPKSRASTIAEREVVRLEEMLARRQAKVADAEQKLAAARERASRKRGKR